MTQEEKEEIIGRAIEKGLREDPEFLKMMQNMIGRVFRKFFGDPEVRAYFKLDEQEYGQVV